MRKNGKILEKWKTDKNIYICGNGGSAANAIHIANDLSIEASKNSKKSIKVESLTANQSILTCIANDLSYSKIFSDQIKKKGKKKDLLIVLSGSGNSLNIINALKVAKKMEIDTFAILGFDGGRCKKLADEFINYKVNDMQISEDIQTIIMNICVKELFKNKIN